MLNYKFDSSLDSIKTYNIKQYDSYKLLIIKVLKS